MYMQMEDDRAKECVLWVTFSPYHDVRVAGGGGVEEDRVDAWNMCWFCRSRGQLHSQYFCAAKF